MLLNIAIKAIVKVQPIYTKFEIQNVCFLHSHSKIRQSASGAPKVPIGSICPSWRAWYFKLMQISI